MPRAMTSGIEIEYETFGDPSGRPLLLIIGLGGQMIEWDENLCRDLVARGHYVIRFDNRDAGLSSKFGKAGVPKLPEVFGKILKGEKVTVPYTLNDMADDAAGLLEALQIPKAHICGMSMGGMIAQTIALRHPERVFSLISIYSTTGNRSLPQPRPEILNLLVTPPPPERQAYIDHMLRVFKAISGPGFPFDESWTRQIVGRNYDRCFYPEGVARQMVAILLQDDRRAALSSLKVPTLVIHGTSDPLVPVEGGKDTAAAVPGAKLVLIEGMGHDLPHGGAWRRIVEEIARHTKDAEGLR
ncbi:MAG TPA: alpha/beta fold hydrolase [Thermodesulfobacteriota bacterium]|nr:alpha/beta fold hydrolase [Thermodesulfobacteriota bacterium]